MNRPNRFQRVESPDVAAVLDTAAGLHGVTVEQVLGRGRTRAVVRARGRAMLELQDRYGWGLSEIGRLFDRSHATVSHAIRRAS